MMVLLSLHVLVSIWPATHGGIAILLELLRAMSFVVDETIV